MVHQVHEHVHRVFQLVDAHVEGEDPPDRLFRPGPFVRGRRRRADDAAADAALGEDARLRPAVDRQLKKRDEHELGKEEGKGKQRQLEVEIQHVADDAHQDAALQQRFGNADAHEAADRLDLVENHGDLDTGVVGRFPRMKRQSALPPTIVRSVRTESSATPAAIDVERELETLLDQGDARVGKSQPENRRESAVLDDRVDDPSLQFQRDGAQQEYGDRQCRQTQLVLARIAKHIVDNRTRHVASERAQPAGANARWMLSTNAASDNGFSRTRITPNRSAR